MTYNERLIPRSHLDVASLGSTSLRVDVATLFVTFHEQRLPWQSVVDMTRRIYRMDVSHLQEIRFDFAHIEELISPWVVHFAAIIFLARKIHPRVRITNLRNQPAAAAWLFRASPKVEALMKSQAALASAR